MSNDTHFERIKHSVQKIKEILEASKTPETPLEVRGGTTIYTLGGSKDEQIAACIASNNSTASANAEFLTASANAVEFLIAQQDAMQNVFEELQDSYKRSHDLMQAAFDKFAANAKSDALADMDAAWNAFEEVGVYLGVIEDDGGSDGADVTDSEEDVPDSGEDEEDEDGDDEDGE